jgi:hypothetical protein
MKKFLLSLIIVVAIGLGGLFVARFLLGGDEDNWICTNNEWIKHGNPGKPMPESGCGTITGQQTQATEKPEIQKYSVLVSKQPVASSHGFSFEAVVTNKSVNPYITDFAFYECNFTDKDKNTYQGTVMAEKKLDKAILPGESEKIVFNDTNTSIKNLKRLDYLSANETWQKCSYDENGQNTCKYIQGMKITSCKAYISSDGSQSGNGWGKDPLNIAFP